MSRPTTDAVNSAPVEVFLSSDHAGVQLKNYLCTHLKNDPRFHLIDLGPASGSTPCDYPDIADHLVHALLKKNPEQLRQAHPSRYGILVCGSGQGVATRANRNPHIRAALGWSPLAAELSRKHNNSNVLCLGERLMPFGQALETALRFLSTDFEGGRHEARVAKLAKSLPTDTLVETDPAIYGMISDELHRQEYGLEMIASENYVSKAVLSAQGSVLTNKYAEGYPGKRYYGGCQHVDQVEQLAIDRAKELFQCEYVNVQPHSGSQANMAVYLALAEPGQVVLGMDLSHGGHLTHGSPVNFSGFLYKAASYGLDPETHQINYDTLRTRAKELKPKILLAGYSAYPRVLDFEIFREIATEVGALLMVDMAHFAGLVAGGQHASPLPFADIVTTTTHKTLRGPRGGMILTNSEELSKKVNSKIFPGIQGGPLEHVIAGKAVSFGEALRPEFKIYATQVVKNAKALADELLSLGFDLVTGGTDNHLILVDLTRNNITGKAAEAALDLAGITVNKNTVPQEKRSPFVTSGIRIGTPALTTRGMGVSEMRIIARWIHEVLKEPENQKTIESTHNAVKELCKGFPIYA